MSIEVSATIQLSDCTTGSVELNVAEGDRAHIKWLQAFTLTNTGGSSVFQPGGSYATVDITDQKVTITKSASTATIVATVVLWVEDDYATAVQGGNPNSVSVTLSRNDVNGNVALNFMCNANQRGATFATNRGNSENHTVSFR